MRSPEKQFLHRNSPGRQAIERTTMRIHTPNSPSRKSGKEHLLGRRRILRWHGPRFIRVRRSTRLTTVWTLRARRLAQELL